MDKLLYQALINYFNALTKLGYMKYSSVNKLLVLIYIKNLLEGDCVSYLTSVDYQNISYALSKLYGSTCLIPYPDITNSALISCGGTEI